MCESLFKPLRRFGTYRAILLSTNSFRTASKGGYLIKTNTSSKTTSYKTSYKKQLRVQSFSFRDYWRNIVFGSSKFLYRLLPHLRKSLPNMDFVPPECVRGMKELDPEAFRKTVEIPGLLIPAKSVGKILKDKTLRKRLMKMRKLRNVAELGKDHSEKVLLFDPRQVKCLDDFTEEERTTLNNTGVDLSSEDIMKMYDIELTYDNLSTEDVMKAILPVGCEAVSGFATIGHIAHLNLKEELLPFKHIIGQVLLDKLPQVQTVVSKTGIIDNTFRNFQMEVLAGEDNMVTTAKENGVKFSLDFSKVYWNPRLGMEHQRVVDMLNKGDVLFDVFAGIGPFSVPAAAKGCKVFANDLNPESYKWLLENIKQNKVAQKVEAFNLDGRDFIRTILKKALLELWRSDDPDSSAIYHVTMNLPALAVTFLDAFRGLYSTDDKLLVGKLPKIHVYYFTKSKDPHEDAKRAVEEVIGTTLSEDFDIFNVRNVAPNKEMMRVSFTVPESVLFGEAKSQESTAQGGSEAAEAPAPKRQKLYEEQSTAC